MNNYKFFFKNVWALPNFFFFFDKNNILQNYLWAYLDRIFLQSMEIGMSSGKFRFRCQRNKNLRYGTRSLDNPKKK